MKKVSIQGIKGSFHHIAANKFFREDIEIIERDWFDKVVADVENGVADFGMMAIENSIAGSLHANYDMLLESDVKIIGEQYLRIKMNLISFPGTKLEDIEEVRSHPIAIAQSRKFLNKYDFEIVETDDTAGSVAEIKEKNMKNSAAIAGDLAAELYEMEIIKSEIETNKENFTRFLVLSKEPVQTPENNKSSIVVELKDQPGSLFKFLQVFDSLGINLTKLESRPIIGKAWEYRFYIDFELDLNTETGKVLLSAINNHTDYVKILGSYKNGLNRD